MNKRRALVSLVNEREDSEMILLTLVKFNISYFQVEKQADTIAAGRHHLLVSK